MGVQTKCFHLLGVPAPLGCLFVCSHVFSMSSKGSVMQERVLIVHCISCMSRTSYQTLGITSIFRKDGNSHLSFTTALGIGCLIMWPSEKFVHPCLSSLWLLCSMYITFYFSPPIGFHMSSVPTENSRHQVKLPQWRMSWNPRTVLWTVPQEPVRRRCAQGSSRSCE